MDALLALIFVFTLIVTGVVLFLTLWIGSILLLVRPQLIADRVVHRFWPERRPLGAAVDGYRTTGALGLTFALIITWMILLEVIR